MRKRKFKDPSKKILLDVSNNQYSITLTREFDFTRYKETHKVCLYNNNNRNNMTRKSIPVYCKYPLYSLHVVVFHPNARFDDMYHFTKMRYDGKFFSFMNHLQDSAKYLKYVYQYNESKLTKRLLDENKRKRIRKGKFTNAVRVGCRLLYENGGGVFNFLYGDLDDFLTVLPDYELRNILKVIRSDYYKLMKSRK